MDTKNKFALTVSGYFGFLASIATVMASALGVIGGAAIFLFLVSFVALAVGGVARVL